jgi:hypothetical protein
MAHNGYQRFDSDTHVGPAVDRQAHTVLGQCRRVLRPRQARLGSVYGEAPSVP